ncbi:hypothetical protein ACE6H2_023153 [Prunus campanulata]
MKEMNVQAHMSGQISGQVPNQAGTQMPVLPQHNGNSLPTLRSIMQEKIYQIIQQQQHPQRMSDTKLREIVKKLDEGLLRHAHTKDDYMNMETLESRLHNLIKRPQNQRQQYQQLVISSSPFGTMIPTPSMSHNGNSNMMVTSSVDASMNTRRGSTSIAPTTVNTGNLLPAGAQSEPVLQGQWHPQSQDGSHRQANMSHEQHVHEDFRQRISGRDEA